MTKELFKGFFVGMVLVFAARDIAVATRLPWSEPAILFVGVVFTLLVFFGKERTGF